MNRTDIIGASGYEFVAVCNLKDCTNFAGLHNYTDKRFCEIHARIKDELLLMGVLERQLGDE